MGMGDGKGASDPPTPTWELASTTSALTFVFLNPRTTLILYTKLMEGSLVI